MPILFRRPPATVRRFSLGDLMSAPEWITVGEAAQLSGYHVNYIRRLVRASKVKAEKHSGHDWWIDKASLQTYVREIKKFGDKKHRPDRDESKGGERMHMPFSWRWLGLMLLAAVGLPILVACGGGATGITNAVLAKDITGDTKDPVGVTNSFPADQAVFHAVVTVSNLPSGSRVKAVWTVVDVGSAAAPNTQITETEVTVEGSRNVDFTLKPNTGQFPPGKFKADIYLNDKLDRTLEFNVG